MAPGDLPADMGQAPRPLAEGSGTTPEAADAFAHFSEPAAARTCGETGDGAGSGERHVPAGVVAVAGGGRRRSTSASRASRAIA